MIQLFVCSGIPVLIAYILPGGQESPETHMQDSTQAFMVCPKVPWLRLWYTLFTSGASGSNGTLTEVEQKYLMCYTNRYKSHYSIQAQIPLRLVLEISRFTKNN